MTVLLNICTCSQENLISAPNSSGYSVSIELHVIKLKLNMSNESWPWPQQGKCSFFRFLPKFTMIGMFGLIGKTLYKYKNTANCFKDGEEMAAVFFFLFTPGHGDSTSAAKHVKGGISINDEMWYFPRPLVHESIFLFRVWWKTNRTRTSVPRQPRFAAKENSTLWFFCLYVLSSYFISPAARQRLYGSSIYDKDFTALLSTAVATARETPKTSLLLGLS